MSEDDHYLSSFLETRLPELGLDFETYGPYVTGTVENDDDDELLSEDVLELLRASSESHGDDDAAWEQFKLEITELHAKHAKEALQAHQDELAKKKQQEHDMLQKEIELAKQKELELEQHQHEPKEELDATKRALMERFAYDESEEYDHDGNLKTTTSDNKKKSETPVSFNKQEATKHTVDEARKTRQAHNTSKKTEQIKTKEAKEAKQKLKEERRKRATKGERRR